MPISPFVEVVQPGMLIGIGPLRASRALILDEASTKPSQPEPRGHPAAGMSFKFNWQFFDVADLQARCQEALTASIAQTRRPASIAAPIRAVNIDFGSKPPQLKFKSIPAVSLTRTHIVFALKYEGDASLTLETEIQANVLNEHLDNPDFPNFVKPKVLGASYGLTLPFMLKIKSIQLDALIDVVYTPSGVVVNFNDDPLKSLDAESSLDSFPFVHTMIRKLLKEQLTVSFFEDIPESVWASTNPNKEHPEPFYGARRWSRHTTQFLKAASFLFPSFGPAARHEYRPFQTLALNAHDPNLVQPRAIPSRASLWRYTSLRESLGDGQELLSSGKLGNFLVESSSVSIASSSTAAYSTSSAGNLRPKRRVISLRKMSKALSKDAPEANGDQSKDGVSKDPSKDQRDQPRDQPRDPSRESSRGSFRDPQNSLRDPSRDPRDPPKDRTGSRSSSRGLSTTPPYSPAPYSPTPRESRVPSRIHSSQSPDVTVRNELARNSRTSPGRAWGSRPASRHSSPKSSRTPLLRSSEFSAIAEDDDDPTFDDPNIALLPPVLDWEHRRFSTPEKSEPIIRKRGHKDRTTSLQQLDESALPFSAGSDRLRTRSPRRYSSTNDLMNK